MLEEEASSLHTLNMLTLVGQTDAWVRQVEASRRRQAEKRAGEIAEFSAQVDDFPVDAIVQFIRLNGTPREFAPIRALSTLLHVPWSLFEGRIVVGSINVPNAGGF
jgi:anion-transporting  ArsA/GET3 family ATPase